MVNLRKIHQVPNYVAGSFQYRGAIVPAIDLCQLLQETPSVPYFSTRIVILNYRQSDSWQAIGIIAQQVTETLSISKSDLISPGMFSDRTPYLGETLVDGQGTIQLIRIENLLGQSVKTLLPEREATPN